VTEFFSKPVEINSGNKLFHILVEGFELGDNPFVERISVYFTLTESATSSESQSKWNPPGEKELTLISQEDQSTAPEATHLTLVYTFSGDIPFDENISAFRSFVGKRAAQAHLPPGKE